MSSRPLNFTQSKFKLYLQRALVNIKIHQLKKAKVNEKIEKAKTLLEEKKSKIKNTVVVTMRNTATNFMVNAADGSGNVLKTIRGGQYFKNKCKANQIQAANKCTEEICNFILSLGLDAYKIVHLRVSGHGAGRNRAISLFFASRVGKNVVSISDVTPIPFSGVKPKKKKIILHRL